MCCDLAADPERQTRFDRGARLLASLNHPHIAQVYGCWGASRLAPPASRAVAGTTANREADAGERWTVPILVPVSKVTGSAAAT